MKLIVGLGNPGEKYQQSKHNVGFMLLDLLAAKQNATWKLNKKGECQTTILEIADQQVLLFKPLGFMNQSGQVLGRFLRKTAPIPSANIYVAHDDLDINLGEYKVHFAKGPHIHNGLLSIYQTLATKDFWHIRIGVDNRLGLRMISGSQYVLQPFSIQEKAILTQVLDQTAIEVEKFVQK